MKIYIGMIAYNEEVFIEASLRSVYDHVDEIIVIDGSPWGPSTDKTAEIARSVGSRVKVISGKYVNKVGTDHKKIQRQAYLNKMDKDYYNWVILHDADEAFTRDNIERLLQYIHNAKLETKVFGNVPINFIADCWHRFGGEARKTAAWRLIPGVVHLNHHRVGLKNFPSWSLAEAPTRIMLEDVLFHHYGHALGNDKDIVRGKCYLERGDFHRLGYNSDEWKRYYKERLLPHWKMKEERKTMDKGVYDGEHPESVNPLIGTYWPKERLGA